MQIISQSGSPAVDFQRKEFPMTRALLDIKGQIAEVENKNRFLCKTLICSPDLVRKVLVDGCWLTMSQGCQAAVL